MARFFLISVLLLTILATPALAESKGKRKVGDQAIEGQIVRVPDESFMPMAPFMVPVIDEDGLVGQYAIMLVLELKKSGMRIETRKMEPRLRNKFYDVLYREVSPRREDGTLPSLETLKHRLTDAAVAVAGNDRIKDVLVQDVGYRTLTRTDDD